MEMMKRIRMKEEWNGGGQGFPLHGRGLATITQKGRESEREQDPEKWCMA